MWFSELNSPPGKHDSQQPQPQPQKKEPSYQIEDPELTKAIINQLSILVTTVERENLESNFKQIRFILAKQTNNPIVINNYYEKLVNLIRFTDFSNTEHLTPIEQLFAKELECTAKDLNYLELLFIHLAKLFESKRIDTIAFVKRFNCESILSFILLVRFVDKSSNDQVHSYLKENSFNLLKLLRTREFPPNYNWTLLLDYILNTPFFPFIHKLLTLSSLQAFKLTIQPINKFYQNILKMSFKELLIEIGPENLLPEKLLPSLLEIKPNEIDQGIALILAEILIPGSQGLSQGLTFANNLPEANAKGAQLQACFKAIESSGKFNVNWYEVFNYVHQYLFDSSQRDIQPSVVSITQFLSSLDFKQEPIDIFLNYEWWFNKTLLYILHSLDASQGGYDISLLNHLAYCFDEDKNVPQTRRNILKFINVGKLELQVVTKIQQQQQHQQLSEQDRKLNPFLNQLFEHDYRVFPEYILAAALTVLDKTQFINDLIDTLFYLLVDSGSPALPKVIRLLMESGLAATKLSDYYKTRKTVDAADKVLSLASSAGLTQEVLDVFWASDLKLAIKLLVESSLFGYDYKSVIEAKLSDSQLKPSVYQALADALDERAQKDYERGQQIQQAQQLQPQQVLPPYRVLKVPVVYYLLEKVKSSNGVIDAKKLKNLQLLLLTTYPRLINFGNGHDDAILANEEKSPFFTSNVELEMKSYYSKMYNKDLEIKEIVDMLTQMKSSDDPHSQDVFACMIHSLLDEYKFFAEYPLSALASTSLLFGALLEKDLIQGTTLTVALNFIWESCNQPQDSHLFKFAVQSLYNFKSRLHEYPIYCKHLLECRSLSAHAKMYQIVKDAANGIACPSGATAPTQTSTPDVGPKYQSINYVDRTIGHAPQEEPQETVRDKLLFSVNNMTGDNLRLSEIQEVLTESYFAWFSNYLVSDRAKAEPNNHELYSKLVKSLNNPIFFEYVLNVSLRENLGAWLGRITLANDKPLRRDYIALKFLLVEAYDFKSLPLIIPFVCKILDQAQYSKVFKPPNPWVLGVMKVLAELYECADLKLQLKFEIEVLLNSFNMKVKDIDQSTLIRTHNPDPTALATMFGINDQSLSLANEIAKLTLEAAQPINNIQAPFPQQPQQVLESKQFPGITQPQLQTILQQQQQQLPFQQQQQQLQPQVQQPQPQPQQQTEPTLDTSFSTLVGNSIFIQNANLRRAFQASLSRAVRECAVPILNRISETVVTTTEALIRKDFATERDVNKLRKSYQKLALQLSHSMVLCSGRKLLAETIEATMLQLLGNNPNEIPIVELSNAIQANVGLCVDIVDRIASENISEIIDEKMQKYVFLREQHNATHPNEPFIEEGASDYSLRLPEPLGLAANGLGAQQLRIYEHFGEARVEEGIPLPPGAIGQPQPQHHQPHQLPLIQQQQQQQQQQQPQHQDLATQQQAIPDDVISFEQLFAAITSNCDKAIQLLSEVTETKLSDLPPNHPITAALTQALLIAQSNAIKFPELLLKAAQYAVNCLFTQTHENPMSNEIYVVILDRLCEYSPSTAKDVTWWLVHSSDQRKFNMPVIFSLLKVQLIQPIKLDASIGKLIKETNSPVLVKFAASLLENVFSAQEVRPIALRSEFANTLDALSKYQTSEQDEEHRQAKEAVENCLPFCATLLLTHGDESTHELQVEFVKGLIDSGILNNSEHLKTFFKAAIEISVTSFATEHELRSRTQHETYLAVDTLAMLIVRIVLLIEDNKQAIDYLKKILGIIILNLINDHETSKANWNERAYFRFFSSLLATWCDASVLDDEATTGLDVEFYNYIGELLNALQPIVLPGFTFAWISLIAHRILEVPGGLRKQTTAAIAATDEGSPSPAPAPSEPAGPDVINVIYKSISRIFIGLLHDYPEFLVERLPEINEPPVVYYKPVEDLSKVGLKKPVENFLRIPAPGLMRTIYTGLRLNQPKEVNDLGYEETVNFNTKLINALVLHVGISSVADRLPNNRGFNTKSSQVSLLVDLMNHGNSEFKYHLINAIANQLRYPNSHTHWFIGIILHFFSNNTIWNTPANKLVVQEIITRVLLERRISNKPHPWGLTILFTELVKNGDYGFFDLPFVEDSIEEIKNIFNVLSVNVKGSTP
ncbi:General negative regulator of transcription subunit 1 [Candida viswanathii]|uniref:General negative regulator of transcription subunit 1 n=1 Tax=Candida viswanathii TaxID=5486 RepID=A0A367XVW4_9ASCO|nr:General negative regulator of transcription subunit 1 [Candida viswanathii]